MMPKISDYKFAYKIHIGLFGYFKDALEYYDVSDFYYLMEPYDNDDRTFAVISFPDVWPFYPEHFQAIHALAKTFGAIRIKPPIWKD